MSFTLRDYQEAAKRELHRRFAAGDTRVPMVLATGLGKTQIFTSYIDDWLAENPGRRALIIAHTDELITQAFKRARAVSPRRRIGIVKAGQNEVLAEIIVSSRQTLASSKRREQLKRVGLIIVDEAHHAVRSNTYGKILEHFGAFDDPSPVLVAGFTATLARSDKAKLSTVWQDCTFTRDILFGIRRGYLLDVRGERIVVPDFDLSRVAIKGGDYSESSLGEELERTFAPEVIAKEYRRLAVSSTPDGDRTEQIRRGIAFWPLVDIAHYGAEAFNAQGIRSAVVSGVTPKPERRELLERFHLPLSDPDAIDVMHNAMVLTEGFDEPTADVVVIARPSKSDGLIQQMVGRVLRPNLEIPPEQREKALILDVRGVADAPMSLHALIDLSPERRRMLDDTSAHGDDSLLELDEFLEAAMDDVEEQRAGSGYVDESPEYDGEVQTVTFDPLGRDKVWGATPAGHHYIKAGTVAYVFLAPSLAEDADPGTYDVVMCSPNNYVRDGVTPWVRGTEHTGLPLEMALNWAEDVAAEVGGPGALTLGKRKSRWRKEAASQAQLKMAHGLGIEGIKRETRAVAAFRQSEIHYSSEMTKGEVSEAIDATYAARRIDPIISLVTQNIEAQHAARKPDAS